jgi:hypothetical protein
MVLVLVTLEMCPHLRFSRLSGHVFEGWCPVYFSVVSKFSLQNIVGQLQDKF